MPTGFFILLLVMLVAFLAGQRLRRRHANDWQGRYRLAQIGLGLAVIAWILFFISNLTNRQPFWPREALSLFFLTVFLGILVYQWQHARRKAAEELSPPSHPPKRKPPAFFWQGVLILLPVAVMAGIALFSLRQDRVLAEQDAKELGASLAQSLVQTVGEETARQLRDYREANFNLKAERGDRLTLGGWAPGTDRKAVQEQIASWQRANPRINLSNCPVSDVFMSEREERSSPGDYLLWPLPASWPQELTFEQQQLWQAAQAAEFAANDLSAAQMALEQLLNTKPPLPARANVEFLLLRLKVRGLPGSEAGAQFAESKWARSDQLSEAGLPLGQLVCYHALHSLPVGSELSDKLINTIAWAIAYRPSIFSPRLIAEAERVAGASGDATGVAALRAWWETEDRTRQVVRDFRELNPPGGWSNALFWSESNGSEYLLAMELNDDSGKTNPASGRTNDITARVLLFPKQVVDQAITSSVSKAALVVPAYATGEIEIAGREWEVKRSSVASIIEKPSEPLLALASGQLTHLPLNARAYPIHVRMRLTSPATLYARQRQRTILFGGVVVASAVVAIIGLFAAHRSFRREQRLNEQKSNFVSSVSHELRAPIASVRLMAESLERGKISEPAKQGEYFRFIGQECRRLSALIENVLDFSRIEQGRKQYEFEPTDLAALTRETVKLMEPYAAERGVRLEMGTSNIQHPTSNTELTHPQPLPGGELRAVGDSQFPSREGSGVGFFELNVDGRAIQQALVNLIDNAIKHSPKGGTVTVELESVAAVCDRRVEGNNDRRSQTAATVHLFVSDHGPGIPAAEHDKIFERFYRLGSELRRETQGVGIGLSIVKHIVEAHGGRVRIESEVGKGSRFMIELPFGALNR